MIADDVQIVLDTNVLVHWLRGQQLGQALMSAYRLGARRPRPVVPVVVKAEILSLALRLNWGDGRQRAIHALLRELPIADISSEPVLAAYARIDSWSLGQGRRMGKNDLWIAALTNVLGATLLTLDNDFAHLAPTHLKLEAIDRATLLASSSA